MARTRAPDRTEDQRGHGLTKTRVVNMTQPVFFGLLFSGILLLLASLMLTRTHWRRDIAPYGRHTRLLHVTMHPEEYTMDAPLRAIRVLSVAGALLLASAAGVLAYELVRASVRPLLACDTNCYWTIQLIAIRAIVQEAAACARSRAVHQRLLYWWRRRSHSAAVGAPCAVQRRRAESGGLGLVHLVPQGGRVACD